MKLIDIRSFRFTKHEYLRKDEGFEFRTVASATLAIHQQLIDREHFAINLTSLVPEDGDCVLVKVYAKTRTHTETGKLDEFVEFPSVWVNDRSRGRRGVKRLDVAIPITKQMRDICTDLVWNEVRERRAAARAA